MRRNNFNRFKIFNMVFFNRYFGKHVLEQRKNWMNNWCISNKKEPQDWLRFLVQRTTRSTRAYLTKHVKQKSLKRISYRRWSLTCKIMLHTIVTIFILHVWLLVEYDFLFYPLESFWTHYILRNSLLMCDIKL